jgi:anti-sigma B factor antagonist
MLVLPQPNPQNVPITVIQIPAGRFNAANALDIKVSLLQAIEANPSHIILDLSLVTFLDSVGISVLVALAKSLPVPWQLKLSGLQQQARPAFDILGMQKVFSLCETIEDATAEILTQMMLRNELA